MNHSRLAAVKIIRIKAVSLHHGAVQRAQLAIWVSNDESRKREDDVKNGVFARIDVFLGELLGCRNFGCQSQLLDFR